MPSKAILKRATTLDELREHTGPIGSEQSRHAALSFRPESNDVLIATYPKCGTTWLQQIVHGLRTRGSMEFDEITAAVPWLELALDLEMDLGAPQAAAPRAFKTHLAWHEIPKGGRYVYVIRDPKDVAVSLYHFQEGWRFDPGAMSTDDYARELFMSKERGRRYWHHVASWWQQRARPDILMLCYEDMKADLPSAVRRIAGFIGLKLDEELLEIVVRQSSIEFMNQHRAKYDDHLVRQARNFSRGIPPGGESAKVRGGRVGDHAFELSARTCKELDAIWREEMQAKCGLPSYELLREALQKPIQRPERLDSA
jgi:hypothetical protein